MKRSLTNQVLLGIGAGYLASKLMDRVTTAYQDRQIEASKQREKELQEEPADVKAAERLAQIRGHDLDQQRAGRLGLRLHRGLGLSGGVTGGLLVARGMNPGRRTPGGPGAVAGHRRGGERALRLDAPADRLSSRDPRYGTRRPLGLRGRPWRPSGPGQRVLLRGGGSEALRFLGR